jgi:hypothetical protein
VKKIALKSNLDFPLLTFEKPGASAMAAAAGAGGDIDTLLFGEHQAASLTHPNSGCRVRGWSSGFKM